ncbi:uncharacterized protein G2W53_000081 [Senna tora]|uniref:RING-type domain-containing protein n=1 Tax=Senna tora TaxID=362788 RepID=A0A835CHD5_9FABA|nr:uncharacterized protein G2W53_000081 [Senna tora]
MAIDNLNNETMPLGSTSLPQRSEEHGFDLNNNDSADLNGVAGGCHHDDMPISLPVVSKSHPFWNVPGISQSRSREIVPAGGNLLNYSSQINSPKNLQTGHHYLHEDHKSLLHRPDLDFPCSNGYRGQPYQYNNHDYLTIPGNSGSAVGPQVLKPSAKAMNINISQPPINLNFRTPQFIPNQGVVSSNCPGKHDERYMTFGSESNSMREFIPPINTRHPQIGSRGFLNPGFDMNDSFLGFQYNNEVVPDLPLNVSDWMHTTDDHKVMFDARPGVGLGPLYDFQGPAVGDHCLRPVNMDLGFGDGKDIGMEIADVSQKHIFERYRALSPLPLVGSQIMQCDNGQSKPSEQIIFSPSAGMMSTQSSSRQPQENNVNSQPYTPPLGVDTGSTRGQVSSSNQGQSQMVGSIQQSDTSIFPSDLGIQTGMEYMSAQVSGSYERSFLKRGASEPQSSAIQFRRRKTRRTLPFVQPSPPTWPPSIPLVPNTSQTIPPLIHGASSLTPQVTHSLVHSSIPALTKSALSTPNISQTIPPVRPAVPSQAYASVPLPPHDKRMLSFLPSSRILHQAQIAQSLPHPRLRGPIIPSAPQIAPVHIKRKDADQTPELIGHKCLLCKRDLSFTPEGPISQPSPPPVAAVLACGHTFHNHCLERITPEDQSKDPPCIPCALRGRQHKELTLDMRYCSSGGTMSLVLKCNVQSGLLDQSWTYQYPEDCVQLSRKMIELQMSILHPAIQRMQPALHFLYQTHSQFWVQNMDYPTPNLAADLRSLDDDHTE